MLSTATGPVQVLREAAIAVPYALSDSLSEETSMYVNLDINPTGPHMRLENTHSPIPAEFSANGARLFAFTSRRGKLPYMSCNTKAMARSAKN